MDVSTTRGFAVTPEPPLTVAEVLDLLAGALSPEEIVDVLDRGAEALLSADLVHRLVPFADKLCTADYADRPWAALPAGVAICAVDRGLGRSVLSAGLRRFEAAGDEYGAGWAHLQEGLQDLGEGNIASAEAHWNLARELLGPAAPASHLSALHLSLASYRVGDLVQAARIAERELNEARLRRDDRQIAVAAIYLALFRWWTGEFAAVERAARSGEEALARLTDPLDRYEEPIMHAALGTVAAMRGEYEAADVHLATGLARAADLQNEWYGAVVQTIRAVVTSVCDPLRGIADAQDALDYYERVGEDWWAHWALEAYVIAQREYGDLHASAAAGRQLLERVDNHLERGRARLELATTLVELGETQEPIVLLEQSIGELETAGARYLTARAELLMGNIDRRRSAYLQRSARARAGADAADPAWKRLLRGGTIRLRLLGVPKVEVDGRAVSFGTRHELEALGVLAFAGTAGVSSERLCETLWPGAPFDSSRHRLDVVLSNLRQGLLPATRLTRENKVLHLDVDADECDLVAAVSTAQRFLSGRSGDVAAAEAACAQLELNLLGGAVEEWIVDAQCELDALRTQLEHRLARQAS